MGPGASKDEEAAEPTAPGGMAGETPTVLLRAAIWMEKAQPDGWGPSIKPGATCGKFRGRTAQQEEAGATARRRGGASLLDPDRLDRERSRVMVWGGNCETIM